AFTRWTFPKRSGGPIQGVDYPLVFAPPQAPPPPTSPEGMKAVEGGINGPMAGGKKGYEEARKGKADLVGEVDIDITIAPAGSVSGTKMTKTTAKFAKVETCINDSVKKWTFPKHSGGDVTIGYPFVLKAPEKKE